MRAENKRCLNEVYFSTSLRQIVISDLCYVWSWTVLQNDLDYRDELCHNTVFLSIVRAFQRLQTMCQMFPSFLVSSRFSR